MFFSAYGSVVMIQSKYIADILDLLLDGDDLNRKTRLQIDFLTDVDYNYTGAGLFVSFSHAEGIEKYRLATDQAIINGVEIKSTELESGAEAVISINNGLIDHLEIWSYSGEYPKKDLSSYTLTQNWKGSPGRLIKAD